MSDTADEGLGTRFGRTEGKEWVHGRKHFQLLRQIAIFTTAFKHQWPSAIDYLKSENWKFSDEAIVELGKDKVFAEAFTKAFIEEVKSAFPRGK